MDIRRLLTLPRHSQADAERSLQTAGLLSDRDREALAYHLLCPGAVSRASRDGHTEVLRLLLESGGTPIYINLLEAIERGHIFTVQLLLGRISPMVVRDELPRLLVGQRREIIELIVRDGRCEPSLTEAILAATRCELSYPLMSYLDFSRAIAGERLSPPDAVSWLIERRVRESQNAASSLFGETIELCEYGQAYLGYFSHALGRDHDCSDLARGLIESHNHG